MRRVVVLAATLVLLAGCSTLKKRARGDITPCAEYTVSLASELQYSWPRVGEASGSPSRTSIGSSLT
jgi:uncharacterized protein YceK